MSSKKTNGRPPLSEEGRSEPYNIKLAPSLKKKALRVGPDKVRKSIKGIKE